MIKFKKIIRKILNVVFTILITPHLIIEICIFLIKNKEIFKNKIVFIFWHWSFGHQVLSYDWISRFYSPNKISLIEILFERNNPYLYLCFSENLIHYRFESLIRVNYFQVCYIAEKIFKIFFFYLKKYQTMDFRRVYGTLSICGGVLKSYNENTGRISEYTDVSGYYHLISNEIGNKPKLPQSFSEEIEKKIQIKYGNDFFKKKFACIILREPRTMQFYDAARGCNQSNYIAAVKFLIDSGFNVIGSGDTNHKLFSILPGYYSLLDLNIDPAALNLYLLMKCSKFISQHSGAYILPNSIGTPVIICDSFPFYIGTFNSDDVILYKNVSYQDQLLSPREIILNHPDVIYGKGFLEGEYKLVDNNSDQILSAISRTSICKLNYPKDTLIAYTNNYIVDL